MLLALLHDACEGARGTCLSVLPNSLSCAMLCPGRYAGLVCSSCMYDSGSADCVGASPRSRAAGSASCCVAAPALPPRTRRRTDGMGARNCMARVCAHSDVALPEAVLLAAGAAYHRKSWRGTRHCQPVVGGGSFWVCTGTAGQLFPWHCARNTQSTSSRRGQFA